MNASTPLICFALVASNLFAETKATFDWPQWQGPDRTAISAETGLLKEWPDGGPPLKWRIDKLGGGYGAPAVARGRIYGISRRGENEVAWALSEADGKELWATTIGTPPEGGMQQGIEGPGCTPTVDGDRMYVLGYGGDLACLTIADGKVVWKRSMTKDFGGHLPTWRYNESPLIDGDKLICTPGGNDATLIALKKLTGEVIWKSVLPGHTDDSKGPEVMATIPALVALDKNSDKEISEAEIDGSPAVLAGLDKNADGKLEESELRGGEAGGGGGGNDRRNRRRGGGLMQSLKLYVGLNADKNGTIDEAEIASAPAALRTLDKNGDKKLVEDEVGQAFQDPKRSGAGYASAIAIDVEGVRQYVQFTAHSLVGVAASDGRLLWRFDKPANRMGINCSSPIYSDGTVFAASAYGTGGGLAKLSKEGDTGFRAEEVWSSKQMENHHGGMVVVDGCLYGANGGNGGGYLICLDFKTGNILWNENDGDKRRAKKGSLAMADNRIYYRTEEGVVLLIEPNRERYVERGRFEQPDRTSKPAWSHPVIANGKLYIRDQDLLLCYDVKAQR
ncbi:MAG: PQQ-binding-like beta-propeller repeat protein [Verrucomicrobiota bacterium]